MITTENIWSQYAQRLRQYISRRVSQPVDREDLLQEIFVKIHSKKHLLNDPKKIRAWVFAIANNAVIDYYKKKKNIASLDTDFSVEPPSESFDISKEETPYRNLSKCLPPFIQRLSPYEQNLINWIDLEGQKQKDVARNLGIPYSTLKSQLQRARKKLFKIYLDCCEYFYDSRGRVMEYEKRGCGALKR